MAKPLLLLDVDGVLANFIEATLTILRKVTWVHVKPAEYTHDDIHTWNLFESLPDHKHFEGHVYDHLKAEGGCFGIPPYPGAVSTVASLKELVDIVIVTSPFYGGKTWVHEREKWLEGLFDISHKDMIHTGRKELVFGDILVDDKLELLEKWSLRHPNGWALLWDQRYNRKDRIHGERVIRVKGWDELLKVVRAITEGNAISYNRETQSLL